ncbi:hypothetical protein K469DRAFT_610122, partial [Zopfia rhizophila CBS 207.26]
KLPKESPHVFALYMQLLLTGHIPTKRHVPENCAKQQELLCRLYVLAEKVQDVNAKDKICDTILALFQKENRKTLGEIYMPGPTAINIVYKNALEYSPGRLLLVDLYTLYAQNLGDITKNAVPKEFLFDLARTLMQFRELPTDALPMNDPPFYHEDKFEKLKQSQGSYA